MSVADQLGAVLAAKSAALVTRSGAALAELLDDGFVYVNAGGRRFDKAGYVAAYGGAGDVAFVSQSARDVTVQDFGGFAVMTLVVDDVFTAGAETRAGTYRSLLVFHRRDELWLWAAGQTMTMAQHPAPRSPA